MLLIDMIKQKGIIELVIHTVWLVLASPISFIRITLLRIRGYNISFSAHLSKDVFLFQSTKSAIVISAQTHIGSGVRIKAGFKGKIHIGKNVLIDDYSFISAQKNITIGDETMIASHCYIVDFNHKYPLIKSKRYIGKAEGYITKPIIIGKYVWIGTHAVILPGVTVGDGAVIGAGSIVTRSVAKNTVVVGNPAKIIKKIK